MGYTALSWSILRQVSLTLVFGAYYLHISQSPPRPYRKCLSISSTFAHRSRGKLADSTPKPDVQFLSTPIYPPYTVKSDSWEIPASPPLPSATKPLARIIALKLATSVTFRSPLIDLVVLNLLLGRPSLDFLLGISWGSLACIATGRPARR